MSAVEPLECALTKKGGGGSCPFPMLSPLTIGGFPQTGDSDRVGTEDRRLTTALLIDVVFGFQALQQWLQEGLVRIRRPADGLRHLFRGCREVSFVGVNACQR